MKRCLYICISLLLLAACSNNASTDGEFVDVNLNLAIADTRAVNVTDEPSPNRYVLEVYKEGNATERLYHQIHSTGNISLRLPVGQYDFYFWADYVDGDVEYYDVTKLSAVSRLMGDDSYVASTNMVCYAGSAMGEEIPQTKPLSVLLTRKVARINLIDTKSVISKDTKVQMLYTSTIPVAYNVIANSAVSGQNIAAKSVYTVSADVLAGSTFAVDYVFVQEPKISLEVLVSGKQTNIVDIPVEINKLSSISTSFQ